MFSSVYQRRLFVTLLVMAISAPAIAYYGLAAMRSIRTSPALWVPPSFQKRQEYDWFERTFETNDAVIISWDGCTIDDDRLAEVYQALHDPDDTPEGLQLREYVGRVFTGRTLIDAMTDYPLEMPEELAKERLAEALIGPDEQTTCCVVLLTDMGVGERKKTIPLLQRIAAEKSGVPQSELHVVGPVFDAYSIDIESVGSMRTFVVPSLLIVITLCRFCLRSWAYTFLVFGIAVFGELLTLSLVYGGDQLFDFGPMNAVLIVMPPLVMVLTVSAAVHLVNYYHDEVRRHGFDHAPRKALRNGIMPCTLATTTTAIGLLSLLLSDIIPVKLFGVYATCGIVSTLVLLLLTLPGAQERWPVPPREGRESMFKDLSGISNFVCRYPTFLVVLCLASMAACGWGLQYMRTSVNVRSLFTPDSRILSDYQWFEENIGPMTPVEVVLHFQPQSGANGDESELDKLERMEVVDQMQKAIASIDEIHGTMSAATFFGSIPRNFGERKATARRLRRDIQAFDDINYAAIFDHFVRLAPGEKIRFSDINNEDYPQLTVEGLVGVPGEPEELDGWSITPWKQRAHFAFVFRGTHVTLYVNGKQVDDAGAVVLPKVELQDDGSITFANPQTDKALALDGLRFSRVARYWHNFTPSERLWDRDPDTIALFYFGENEAKEVSDDSGLHTVVLEDSQKSKRRLEVESWRIGGRVAALGDPSEPELDYGEFLAEIQHQIDPRLWAVHYMRDVREVFRGVSWTDMRDKHAVLIGVPPSAVAESDSQEHVKYSTSEEKSAAIFANQLAYLLTERGFLRENIKAVDLGQRISDEQLAQADLIVSVGDSAEATYEQLVKQAENVIDARMHHVILDPKDSRDTRIVKATYTGVMPLAYEVQNALLNDLIRSFLSAVLLVSVVMIILQRSPVAGLVAMLPNLFPMVILFGITSGLGMAIDIGTVMTASVALGIAVDDTLHFLTWFNREHSETGDNIAGVKLAFRHCAKAMLQTTLICSLGLAIYSFSWFMPTRRFSWMMVSLLMAAVVGDLIFLPAILASPIGKLFPKRKLMGDPLATKDVPLAETAPSESE